MSARNGARVRGLRQSVTPEKAERVRGGAKLGYVPRYRRGRRWEKI
jgi:hypothetical protein